MLHSETTLPIEVHVFEHSGEYFAFDARSYAILRLDELGATVLDRMSTMPAADIAAELATSATKAEVFSRYLEFLDLIDEGVLSSRPVPRPNRPPFNRLVLMLAGGCNMGCTYCFEKDVPIYQNKNLLSKERADDILDWFFEKVEGDTAHIQLYGGEPLLNWPILTYVVESAEARAAHRGLGLTKYLITNGTLLTRPRIEWLTDHAVSIQVSVDGDKETHDRLRVLKSGRPTMDRISPNIATLAETGADFNLRAVVTRLNPDPKAVIDGLRAHGADRVSFEVVATDDALSQFTRQDWKTFNERYAQYVEAPYTSWQEIPEEIQGMISRICQGQRVFYGCGAGVSEVTIAPDGSIYECQRIYRDPYSNVDNSASPTELGSTLLTMVDDRNVCKDCWARYLCGGGCMHQSHVGHQSDDPLPEFCEMKRTTAEAAIAKVAELRDLASHESEQ
jgi:uncharacterized protein